jgi:hypothetical protein
VLIQRDPDVWGDNAETFDPKRWLDGEGRFRWPEGAKDDGCGFQAFNLGPRTVSDTIISTHTSGDACGRTIDLTVGSAS